MVNSTEVVCFEQGYNEKIRQDWNSTDSSWVNDYRYLYEYDINNVLLLVCLGNI